jgi:DNA-directed RNA polymerase subunit M/transcription elongation factor TFIIS
MLITELQFWRNKGIHLFESIFPNDQILITNIEISIYNWSMLQSRIIKHSYVNKIEVIYINNDQGIRLLHHYRQKTRSLLFNMTNNNTFRELISKRKLEICNLPYLLPIDISPDKWNWIIEKRLQKALIIDAQRKKEEEDKDSYKGLFICEICRKSNTRHISLQIRSADEPETIFIFCKNCDIQWKI